jgi:hypothetical protein
MKCFDTLGLKQLCNTDAEVFIDDFVTIDYNYIYHTLDDFTPTPERLAESLLKNAINTTLAEFSAAGSVANLRNYAEELNSANYSFGSGVISGGDLFIIDKSRSSYTKIRIDSLVCKPDFTADGLVEIVNEIGEVVWSLNYSFVGGQVNTIIVNQVFNSNKLTIRTNRADFYMINSAADCTPCSMKTKKIIAKGFNIQENFNLYKFIPYGALICSEEEALCSVFMDEQIKRLMYLLISYNFVIALVNRLVMSSRLTDSKLNIDENNLKNYMGTLEAKSKHILYGDVMSKNARGVKGIFGQVLRQKKDFCIECIGQVTKGSLVR